MDRRAYINEVKVTAVFKDRWDDKIRKRVNKGAAHLDRVRPDWYERVKPDTLNMAQSANWVAAQVAGMSYRYAYNLLDLEHVGSESGGFVCDLGICADGMQYYAIAQKYWLGEVEKRLDGSIRQSSCKYRPTQVNQTEET